MEKTMKRYRVNHRFSTSYHPQTSGQVKNTNIALKRILEKTVKDNLAIWSRKLDDALWAFRTAYKTPTDTTPYKLIYGKNCHLPFEIEHRAYWALKNCNPDLIIWKAFKGNTRDLGSFEEETDKTTNLHQHLSRSCTQKLETASQITRDDVTTQLKTTSQAFQTASNCTTQPKI
ncbi:reverse transcriptase domain-containing protein [Tanacetum coccineum]